MLGNFTYCNPTRLYFGADALQNLRTELEKYGPVVQLIYGGGSIKRNGIYDEVVQILADLGKTVVEDAGVMPNPTVEKLRAGAALVAGTVITLFTATLSAFSVCAATVRQVREAVTV